ncbi:MAG: hypothetical protein A2Z57_15150 [Planctomycetes bacterium RIFCSPHIGHO2_12_39_6]|nr:MAG: hypothetical protein A2Z57_15150 [Planctomycetes bacterium RIFCSPHIGHO2_12_39_6]
MKKKVSILPMLFLSMSLFFPLCLTGCFTTDKHHNKEHIDTMKKDMGLMHKDIDRALGLDEPSPLVEKE